MKRLRISSVTAGLLAALLAGLNPSSQAANPSDRMLAHDVYFSLKDNSPQAKERLIAACKKCLSGSPGIVWLAVGPLAEDLKREVNDQDFDVALHIVFKDKAAHDQYQKSEQHLKLIAENKESLKKIRVFDSYVEVFVHGTAEGIPSAPPGLLDALTGYTSVLNRATTTAAKTQIDLFKVPIEAYKLDVGDYPTTEQGLRALRMPPDGLANPAKWSGPYLAKEVPLDPWKRPYHYRYPGKHVPGQPDIWSSGPDGIDGTEDDISNWKKK
jgi:type II secretion system protein G